MELRPGTLLAGKLRLVGPLGQGGMGSVWLAEHLALEMEVAVKLIRPERAGDASLRSRFEREAKAAARIASPHVVQIKDYGLAGDTPYIVMERLHGRSLHEALRGPGGRMRLTRLAAIVTDVAEALAAAHALGIVHRDIKPQNIFLAQNEAAEIVKVLDFGVAKILGEIQVPGHSGLTETGTVIGSPPYMSPEQLEGRRDVDHRTDLWSLGVVTYQALTGALPFEGGSFVRVGAAVLGGRYAPVTTLDPTLPRALDDWFARALCVDPEARFPSARAMAEALVALARRADDHPAHDHASEGVAAATTPGDALAHATTEEHALATITSEGPVAPPGETATTGDTFAESHAGATGESHADAREPSDTGVTEIASSIAVAPRPAKRRRLALAALIVPLGAGAWLATKQPWRPPPVVPTATAAVALAPDDCPPGTVFVAGGAFDMGSEPDDEVLRNETPIHPERVSPFCIDVTEVTVDQYAACRACAAAPRTVEGAEITLGGQQFWSRFCNGAREGRGDHPVNCVSWLQAEAYCTAQGKRLPSEAEWEIAARGADRRPYPWGHEPPTAARLNGCGAGCSELLTRLRSELDRGAWPSMYPEDDGAPDTSPVGAFPRGASPAGVMDMAGNVWEWTASPYCPYDARDCGDTRRVLRGGGWSSPDPKDMRVTRRLAGSPSERSHGIGFRCVWSR